MTGPMLELNDIQGNILLPFSTKYSAYVFLKILDTTLFRESLQEFENKFRLQNAEQWKNEKPQFLWNIAISYYGLKHLLNDEDFNFKALPKDFSQGMKRRAALIADTGNESPDNWEVGNSEEDIHLLLMIYSQTNDDLTSFIENVKLINGCAVSHLQRAERLDYGKEWFGYSDGISQPLIEGSPLKDEQGFGCVDSITQKLRPLKPGLFLLGYETEGTQLVEPFPELKNGTFLVIRKLKQDIQAFNRFLNEQSKISGCTEDVLAAKLMGRYRSGVPLVSNLSGIEESDMKKNDFTYKDDLSGHNCPLWSHIRRVNSRESGITNSGSVQPFRRRIIRRGMTYQNIIKGAQPEDGQIENGLVFIALNSSIEDQFEFIQKEWVRGRQFVHPEVSISDPIASAPEPGRKSVSFFDQKSVSKKPLSEMKQISGMKQFVQLRGGGYFFMPSISFLINHNLINKREEQN